MTRSGLFVAAALAALAVTAAAQQIDTAAANAKLTTVLADLVTPTGSPTTLTTGSQRPRSVNDAIQSRRLRIDANNEVQVYILMSELTDESIRQLTDAGVTIEIRDPARRRVQARLPVS